VRKRESGKKEVEIRLWPLKKKKFVAREESQIQILNLEKGKGRGGEINMEEI